MKPRLLKISVAAALLALSGCATMSNWQPTIDAKNDPHKSRIYTDLAECKQLARQASGLSVEEVGKNTVIGGAVGAAGGAAIGAAAGNAGTGAAVGAAAVGLGSGIYTSLQGDEQYKRVYAQCMQRRGHTVLN